MERSPSSDSALRRPKMKLEKNAGLIMGTNNSSIVSKRSVERLYLPEPHFYRYFVRKPQRRSPTINRGYWLRMKAIDHTVRRFLERKSTQPKVVVNLGCGYDPLPFQWLAMEPHLCTSVKFIDVDYEELMISKRDIIMKTPQMNGLLTIDSNASPQSSVLLDSKQYAAIGCDLRDIERLEALIKSVVSIHNAVVLLVAEVSIAYMHPDAADAVLAWSSTLTPDTTFCLLEQRSPDRPDNPFTATMLRHFEKLGTPLRCVLKYSGDHDQTARFFAAGFTNVDYQSLWEFWANPNYMSPSQRLSLDNIEPFDEWEEFALFASHYCLVVAHNRVESVQNDTAPKTRPRRDSCASIGSELSTRTVSPVRHGTQWFAYRYCKNPEGEGRTYHGSTFPLLDGNAIAIYGGIGPHARINTTSVYAPAHSPIASTIIPESKQIAARCCHTVTLLPNGQNILVGGRASPTHPMKDCWIQSGSSWERIEDLPEPRYRHRTVPVALPDNDFGVVVFGGKSGPSAVHSEYLLWSSRSGWQNLRSLRHRDPIPRFSPTFIALGNNHGVMFGGMRQDGVICQGFWRWRLIIRDCIVEGISFKESIALDVSVGVYPWLARLGAQCSLIRNELLIIGGIAKFGCIPKTYEILSFLGSFSAIGEHEHEMDLRLTCVEPILAPGQPRPFLIGHSAQRTKNDQTLLVGGGAVCFSFGSYYNRGVWLLHDREAGLSSNWSLVKVNPSPPSPNSLSTEVHPNKMAPHIRSAQRVYASDEKIFEAVVQNSIPVVIEALDFGACTKNWTSDYLKSKIPPERTVMVHRATSRTMNFQRKDFVYASLPFHAFLDATLAGLHVYLRSLSSKEPTNTPANFRTDFPEIAEDFKLPSALALIESPARFHSSPLRISSNVNMWLHYDVMANVLFQIRGSKQLLLFPPHDIKYLDFPPGATTSRIEVFTGADRKPLYTTIPERTTPILVNLAPGEAVFIPPLWAHATAPITPSTDTVDGETATDGRARLESNVNISLNTFFRTLAPHSYAAGRDVYGNRDFSAYEDGRRDVERIVQRFLKEPKAAPVLHHTAALENGDTDLQMASSIPKEIAKAYLERLAAELLKRAEDL